MEITGIICEYNPFHNGHRKQLHTVQRQHPQGGIVCLMSGNYVQRGAPAVFDKSLRASAAVRSGADLVLELPIGASLSSAEGFAAEGVRILSGFCKRLCFGAETGTATTLMDAAKRLQSPEFTRALHMQLDMGLSFPAARQAALGSDLLSRPNDILAVEYCKAILNQGSALEPMVIRREGSYHAAEADPENPSATSLRAMLPYDDTWLEFVPREARSCFAGAVRHELAFGERGVLARLRAMTEAEFEAMPHGSEGLWRKFMHAVRSETGVEDILTAVKSKRYTRTRLDRMLMCAYLGITREMLEAPAPYVRVLAFNDKGREILRQARQSGQFINAGEATGHPYEELEQRCGDLYGLFAESPEAPSPEKDRRVIYVK